MHLIPSLNQHQAQHGGQSEEKSSHRNHEMVATCEDPEKDPADQRWPYWGWHALIK